MHIMRIGILVALMVSSGALAGELEGVSMPDKVTVEGKELTLNGLGLRKKFVFNVYVAGLFVEHPSQDPSAILGADETRRVEMKMLRDLEKKAVVEAIRNGFEKNAGEKLAGLSERLEKFSALIPDLKKGQTLSILYVPGKGTKVEGGKDSYLAEGKDFADALFSVWIGKVPVDGQLKKGMLGAK
jgi:hypothetical protein